MNNSSKDYQG